MIFPLKILKMLKSKLKGLKPMERYKIIKNTMNKYPIYYVIDTKTGYEIAAEVSYSLAARVLTRVKEASEWDNLGELV